MLTFGSLFAGIGGFDLGFERAGLHCLWQVEIEKKCRKLLAAKFPKSKQFVDVKECGAHNLDRVNVLTMGFPCQGASVAGAREGLGDPRTGLFYQGTRIANELQPDAIVFENVPGLLSVSNGWDFVAVLHEFGRIGYHGGWRTFDAQYFGLAQRRRRIFGVFTRRDIGIERAVEILSLSEGLRGHPAPSRRKGQRITGTLTSGALDGSGACGGDGREQFLEIARAVSAERDGYNDGSDQTYIPAIAPTLDAGSNRATDFAASGGVIPQLADPLVPKEGETYTHEGSGNFRLRNCIPYLAPTLNDVGGNGRPGDSVQSAGYLIPDIAWTLQERDSKGSDSKGSDSSTKEGHLIPAPLPFEPNQLTSPHNRSNPKPGDPAPTLANNAHPPAIAFSSKDHGGDAGELAPTMRSGGHRDSHANAGVPPAIASRLSVRRLTPLECERLQGFPDNWTAGFKDGPRYKMLGNAVAVSCSEWLGRRIVRFLFP